MVGRSDGRRPLISKAATPSFNRHPIISSLTERTAASAHFESGDALFLPLPNNFIVDGENSGVRHAFRRRRLFLYVMNGSCLAKEGTPASRLGRLVPFLGADVLNGI